MNNYILGSLYLISTLFIIWFGIYIYNLER
jgi:hypothetical protein